MSMRWLMILAVLAGCSTSRDLPLTQGGTALAAAQGPWRVQLVDGNGYPLRTYGQGHQSWVLGAMGQRYGVRVDNPTAQRIEVVVTVDGRDSINGAPGSLSARGYIVEPYGHVLVDGFRTSAQGVAAFRFTTPGDSYANRVGAGENIGVIGVAVFAERAVAVARPANPWLGNDRRNMAPPAASKGMGLDDAESGGSRLGTQYGEYRHSPTVEVQFQRASSEPAAVMAVYYDDHQGLARRGIIAQPYAAPVQPTPFPAMSDRRYAPPPP